MKPKIVGAQKAMKIASNLSPVRKIISETMIIDRTTSSIMKFITPMRSKNFLSLQVYYSNQYSQ